MFYITNLKEDIGLSKKNKFSFGMILDRFHIDFQEYTVDAFLCWSMMIIWFLTSKFAIMIISQMDIELHHCYHHQDFNDFVHVVIGYYDYRLLSVVARLPGLLLQ